MKRRLNLLHPIFILSFGMLMLLLASCQNEEVCEEAASAPLRMGFYLPVVADGKPQPYTVDSLSVYGLGRPDSLIYNNSKNVRAIEVPVDPTTKQTGYVLTFPANIVDTVWVEYNHNLSFISAECGFTMHFEIISVKHTTRRISTFQLVQNQVTQSLEEHIKILVYPDAGN